MPRKRNNPLALAVLMTLAQGPKHPYEIATTLRRWHKDEAVKLNYGSLYSVVRSLERRNLIAAQDATREGRFPERTVYRLTEQGRLEAHGWLSEIVAVPVNDYTAFEAGLSFLPGLTPEEAVTLLEQRAGRLEEGIVKARALREICEQRGLPRVLWIEAEYEDDRRHAELAFVRRLLDEIASDTLDGLEWWRAIHSGKGSGAASFESALTGGGVAA
jgi:DNA-binding PadR family transcriptional regulator